MPYQVNVFQSWVNYTSWDDLKQFLTSEAGGLLRVVEPRDSPYALVRYTKGVSNMALSHVRWCRSLIVHKKSRLPVCVSPPTSDEVTETTVNDATVAEEFVEGTMVNVFHAATDETAVVATRSRIGADKSFFQGKPTFRVMLEDAMKNQGIASFNAMLPTHELNHFTSVVLKHPSNRMVQQVESASFVIVHQGWVQADGTVFIEENPENFNCVSSNENDGTEIQGYNLETLRAAKSVKDWVSTQVPSRAQFWQGVVLKDGNGRRWRVRSDTYEVVRRLRGNESSVGERFARVRKQRCMEQYLSFFVEESDAFYEYEGLLRKNTRTLLRFYVDTFRSRAVPFHELPWPYKHHVSVLHNLYKNTLRVQKKRVELDVVIRYINGLSLEDTVNMLKEHSLELVKKAVVADPVDLAAVIDVAVAVVDAPVAASV